MRLLMLGLSESGKTTFLAALYELTVEENAEEDSLREREKLHDREYFSAIRRRWLQFQELLHSQRSIDEMTTLNLVSPDGRELDLEIPDIAGESFDEAWSGESWPAVVREHAIEADGILVFLRADDFQPPHEFEPGEPLGEWKPSEIGPEVAVSDGEPGKEDDWNPEAAPTQTKLADLLEGIEHFRHELVPTAVIISAWDTVEESQTPNEWLEFETPLFWQMLKGLSDKRPFSVFGISAQGGDITDPAERQRMSRISPPINRVTVQGGDEVVEDGREPSHDLSAPIRWLMNPFE